MNLDPQIMTAVERLNYRVTVGDVAAQAGLNVNLAEQGLLALASEAGGHLQVAESGDIAYLFPRDFRSILRNKYLRLRLEDWWNQVWKILFYLIRISFGIVLVASILLIFVAIFIIIIAASASRDSDSDSGGVSMPNVWVGPDFFWIFSPNYYDRPYDYRRSVDKPDLNFLESVFSFLFGDGDPNADLEERRWRTIATVIQNNRGAVIAEQISPYLNEVGQGYAREYEEYMLPVLTRFNGRPEVSPAGGLVYQFTDLQTTAVEQRFQPVAAYLKELPHRFSRASGGQIATAIVLGCVNLGGALWLGSLLAGGVAAAELGGLVAFVQSIYWLLLGYGSGFLVIPAIRYFWVKWRNRQISDRNQQRQERAMQLNEADADLQAKLAYAQQFTAANYIEANNLAYTTERDLIEQEVEQTDKLDAEWQRRLEER